MEPIVIALIVSVMFNFYCFKEIKALTQDLNVIRSMNEEIKWVDDKSKLKSLGYINVYKQSNGKHRISSIPQTKQYTRTNRKRDAVNTFIGTSEVFISKPEK